jgi:hypothetical protein
VITDDTMLSLMISDTILSLMIMVLCHMNLNRSGMTSSSESDGSEPDTDSESAYRLGETCRFHWEIAFRNCFYIWKVGSCYVTCYITGGVLYHIFLLCNTLYAPVI